MDARFRVSPSSFFQTNSAGAVVLYKTIAEKFNLYKIDNTVEQKAIDAELIAVFSKKDLEKSANEGGDEPEIKMRKLEKVMDFSII